MRHLRKLNLLIISLLMLTPWMCNAFNGVVSQENNQGKLDVIIIDPGHGGKDYGTSIGDTKEKDIVLDISLKLGKYINEAFPEIKVIYTRTEDKFIPLKKRAEIANKNNADLFISIHVNYVGIRSVTGTETFVLGNHRSKENLEIAKKENAVILLEDNYHRTYEGFDPNSYESYIMFETIQNEYRDQSLQFASFIREQFKNVAKRNDRGVKEAGFIVLYETTMPGVLIETGFISNENEKKYLTSNNGKTEIAKSVFDAFADYKRIFEDRNNYSLNSEPQKEKTITPTKEVDLSQTKKTEQSKTTTPTKKADTVEEKKPAQNQVDNSTTEQKKSKEKSVSSKPAEKNISTNEVYFSVQIFATSKKLESSSKEFKGETDIHNIESGNFYKYYKGRFKNYDEANREKNRLIKKFDGAFLVAFKGDKRITIKQALDKAKN